MLKSLSSRAAGMGGKSNLGALSRFVGALAHVDAFSS